MREKWTIAENTREHMFHCVYLYKENGYYSIYRCIDDSDDEGFSSPFNCDYYYNLIPEDAFKLAIKAKSDRNVTDWIRSHLIKGQSDSPDNVIAFLDENGIPCKFGWTYQCVEG